MVVVDAPALAADDHDLLLAVALQGREVRRNELDVDAKVLLPLRLQVLRPLVVAGARVVAILEVLYLAAGRVPLLVELLGLLRVELGELVAVVAQVGLLALGDGAADGGLAGDRVRERDGSGVGW